MTGPGAAARHSIGLVLVLVLATGMFVLFTPGCAAESSRNPSRCRRCRSFPHRPIAGRSFGAREAVFNLGMWSNGFGQFLGTTTAIQISDYADQCTLDAKGQQPPGTQNLVLVLSENDAQGLASLVTAPATSPSRRATPMPRRAARRRLVGGRQRLRPVGELRLLPRPVRERRAGRGPRHRHRRHPRPHRGHVRRHPRDGRPRHRVVRRGALWRDVHAGRGLRGARPERLAALPLRPERAGQVRFCV